MHPETIILLPKKNYYQWVKAAQKFVLAYGVNLTPDPAKAGLSGRVILPASAGGYAVQGDICAWLGDKFPGLEVDAVPAGTPEEFQTALKERIESDRPFGPAGSGPLSKTMPEQQGEPASPETTLPMDRFKLFWPTDFPMIVQGFGANPEIYGQYGLPGHEGLDIRAPMNTHIYACAEGEVYHVEKNPDAHPYGKHVRIRHAGGYRTVYAHLAETAVEVGERVETLQLIGKADSTGNSTGAHLHLTLKKDGATQRGETHFQGDVIDPTPYLVYAEQEASGLVSTRTYPWTQPCLVGINGREDGQHTDADYGIVSAGRIEAFKIREDTSTDVITRLRGINPPIFIMARLGGEMGSMKVAPVDWVQNMRPYIDRLYKYSVRYFEILQSPNLQRYGWNTSWHSGGGFARWWMDVVGMLKPAYPEAKFGFPGVSPGGQVEGQRLDAATFLEQADEAVHIADWVGANCYWRTGVEMHMPEYGAFYQLIRKRHPDKLLFITEFANVNALINTYVKGQEYVQYYETLREQPGIAAAFSQLISSASGHDHMLWRNELGELNEIPAFVGMREF